MLLDVTPQRAVAEWWFVDTVLSPSNNETMAAAFETQAGIIRLQPAAPTNPRPNAPALAPDKLDGGDD
ncbi:MAG: hypothetical protein Q8K96_18820 [Rubrivivax sp.]|nr:hypothetical protein [Rubrivivax sp.]